MSLRVTYKFRLDKQLNRAKVEVLSLRFCFAIIFTQTRRIPYKNISVIQNKGTENELLPSHFACHLPRGGRHESVSLICTILCPGNLSFILRLLKKLNTYDIL